MWRRTKVSEGEKGEGWVMALIALNGSGPQAFTPPGPLAASQYRALGQFFLPVEALLQEVFSGP